MLRLLATVEFAAVLAPSRKLNVVLTVFNASPEPQTIRVQGLAGKTFTLSSVQAKGKDAVVKSTKWNRAAGTITVPARTVAVLVQEQQKRGRS